jgi:hypothetical protein
MLWRANGVAPGDPGVLEKGNLEPSPSINANVFDIKNYLEQFEE